MSEGTKGLRLYNTLTRTKEEFAPIDPGNVRMYVCGPTVYDFAHIGNARPAIVFDVLYRLLRHLYGPDHVTYVRNITDVDDKINARALRDFPELPLNDAIRKVTEPTYDQYQRDVTALGCLPPTFQPRATEFVLPRADGKADMVTLIQRLIDGGHAYEASGEILFDTASMADYGQLSKRNLDEQQAGARVAVDAHKRNPQDFVLWKESSAEEPGWDAGFTLPGRTVTIRGRPGWHIECSAMSAAYLGDVFDIHGGGLDLIFPHHENEIAQSRCAHGTHAMANIWMHNGFLQVEGKKMSKSDGNFVTINELLNDWSGPVMRLVMLQTHYRQPINWTSEKLSATRGELADWASRVFDGDLLGHFEANLIAKSRGNIDERVLSPLLDDLNTGEAVAGLRALYVESAKSEDSRYALLNAAHFLGLLPLRKIGALLVHSNFGSAPIHRFSEYRDLYLTVQTASANSQPQVIESANAKVARHNIVFTIGEGDGFVSLDKREGQLGEGDNTQDLINLRLAYIAQKNWAEADRIRDELLAQGIQLKDGKDPVTGERVTTWEVKR